MEIDPESHEFRIKILEDKVRVLEDKLRVFEESYLEGKLAALQAAVDQNRNQIGSNFDAINKLVKRMNANVLVFDGKWVAVGSGRQEFQTPTNEYVITGFRQSSNRLRGHWIAEVQIARITPAAS
jgi:hypothetical protein